MGLGLQHKLDCGCGCGGAKKSDLVKWKYSFYSALIFFIISNPELYKLTTKLFGRSIASDGCARPVGLLLHSFVFMLIVFFLMKIGA
jgi:hypothetical protein